MDTTDSARLNGCSGIIFDLDGTLTDTENLHFDSTLSVLSRYQKSISRDEFAIYEGLSETDIWDDLQSRLDLQIDIEELVTQRTAEFVKCVERQPVRLMPGAHKLLLSATSKQIPLGIASNLPRAQIDAILSSCEVDAFFPVRKSGHDDVQARCGKPAPDVYLAAAKAMQLPVAKCIAIEDSETGIRSAKAAGTYVIGVGRSANKSPLADCSIESLDEAFEVMRVVLE